MSSAPEEINRFYYERVAPGVHDYWRKMAAPRFRVATLLRLVDEAPPRQLCDLGCGGGQFLLQVQARYPGALLCGVDLSQAQIELNRRLHPDIRWVCLDLDQEAELPHDLQGACDTVVAMELIEHLAHPEALLRIALRLARPAGRLLLSTQSGPVRETERRVGHRRHFTAREMHNLLIQTGWRPVRVWNCGFPFHDLSKWYANRNPQAMLRRFGEGPYGLREDLICLVLRLLFRLNSRRRGAQLFAVAER
ncbi:MAG: methyltransferase domain-containing protein [Myxococcales bacterium]|nr:methyltransferase domain-containing protein [Myxococcota bacterium]MDW8281079.1 methyltransferase domain-containing protein [Myxococcales bacterium]